jgi:hypothetical protein
VRQQAELLLLAAKVVAQLLVGLPMPLLVVQAVAALMALPVLAYRVKEIPVGHGALMAQLMPPLVEVGALVLLALQLPYLLQHLLAMEAQELQALFLAQ